MHKKPSVFGQRLRDLMYYRKLTVEQLANQIDVSKDAVIKWRAGQIPTVSHLNKLAGFFGLKMEEMLKNIEQSKGGADRYGKLHPLDAPADIFSKETREHLVFMEGLTPEKAEAIEEGFRAYLEFKFGGVGLGKMGVDKLPHSVNTAGMSNMEILRARLKAAVNRPGKRQELAEFMKVAPPRISEWLNGSREPGGEYALMLLNWVEQQERS